MLFECRRWLVAPLAVLLGACATEVAGDELVGDVQPASAIEPAAQALTSPADTMSAVWLDDADRPVNEEYEPDAGYRLQVQHVKRTAAGKYQVVLAQHGLPSLAFVTAYGTDNVRCKVEGFSLLGLGLYGVVNVKCHTAGGVATDSSFVMVAWTSLSLSGRVAGGKVSAAGQVSGFNGVQGTLTATRTSSGNYTIRLGGLGATEHGGTVQVGAVGASTHHCKVVQWGSDGSARTIQVRCFAPSADTASDSDFMFLYDEQIPTQHNRGAYAWANNQTSSSYQPDAGFTFMRGPSAAATSTSATGSLMPNQTGHYKMVYQGLSEDVSMDSYVFVGAYGGGGEYCKVRNWSRVSGCATNCNIEVQTLCFDKSGNRTNTRYVQTWGSFRPFGVN